MMSITFISQSIFYSQYLGVVSGETTREVGKQPARRLVVPGHAHGATPGDAKHAAPHTRERPSSSATAAFYGHYKNEKDGRLNCRPSRNLTLWQLSARGSSSKNDQQQQRDQNAA
jgi:hypothetical protein